MAQAVSRRSCTQWLAAATLFPARAFAASGPIITVHKDPSCDCCTGWATHLKQHGFRAQVVETQELNSVKSRLGVPSDLAACHTAEVNGFVLEGHVPAAAVQRFLAEHPQATGLAVPGMPSGSPGMGGIEEEYEVILFGRNEWRVYARFKGEKEV